MRELNECTAEVFRRGEQRIRERRRKRGRILAVCIPVCLIAAVWSAVIFPPMTPEMESNHFSQAAGEAAGSAPESVACPYTAVEIQAGGLFPAEHSGKVTDPAAAAEMFDAVNSLFADPDGSDRNVSGNVQANEIFPTDENSEYRDQTESEGTSKSKDYTITFTARDGSRAVYRLSGNTLANVNTNETVFLSGSQAAGLMAVLGISE